MKRLFLFLLCVLVSGACSGGAGPGGAAQDIGIVWTDTLAEGNAEQDAEASGDLAIKELGEEAHAPDGLAADLAADLRADTVFPPETDSAAMDVTVDVLEDLVPDVPEVPPACPVAPPECGQAGGAGSPVAGKVTQVEGGGLRLQDQDQWTGAAAIIEALAGHLSVTPVSLATVLQNLNRDAAKVSAKADVACFNTGYEWNSGDQEVAWWIPQGIAGTATAYQDGTYNGRKLSLVSWHNDPGKDPDSEQDKGVRISIADATDISDVHYRLALLVEPFWNGTTPDFRAVKIHAGGIAWYRDYLYVADTAKGFRVFDLTRILEVRTGQNEWIGKVSEAEGYHAFNYRYVIPQVNAYSLGPDACCARFSFAELDLTSSPISLVAGEYTKDEVTGRLHRWPMDQATGRMVTVGGVVTATEALFPGVKKMQGGMTWAGNVIISSSHDAGTLYTGAAGKGLSTHAWPYIPEDLHYSPFSDNLWCLTEQAGSRFVFSVKLADILGGCK